MPFSRRAPISKNHFDPAAQRESVRLTNIYATPWHLPIDHRDHLAEPSEHLRLGRLKDYFVGSAAQLPRVLHRTDLPAGELGFQRWEHAELVNGARLWLFATPSGQIVVALSLDVNCELLQTIDLLEDCYYLDVRHGQERIEALAAVLAERRGGDISAGQSFFPERHQIAFGPTLPRRRCEDIIQRVIYRSDLPYRKEFSAIGYPPELNRRPETVAAVGPYVSVLGGQQDYLENSVFLSAVQAVASAARLREIRTAAYSAVETFRAGERTRHGTQERRRVLERLSDQLGDMELELSYSVEASADLGLLVPSLRVVGYHDALYEAMDLVAKAETVARMLRRLERAIHAELTAIESVERRADEDRRLRWTIAVGFVSTVAIPVGLVLAFFGINAREVNEEWSMFDSRYAAMYLLAGGLVAIGILVSTAFYFQQRRSMRLDDRDAVRPRSNGSQLR